MTKFSLILTLFGLNILFAQDTLSGNYSDLRINKGFYLIRDNITVDNSLTIDPGAIIQIQKNASIIIGGELKCIGDNEKIEIYGLAGQEGSGIIIKNSDSLDVQIKNTVFKNLLMPINFDYGWKRRRVSIENNQFLKNKGTSSIIQVLSPPFDYENNEDKIEFELVHNLFSGNNAPIYFEDFSDAKISYKISLNAFVENKIFGNNNHSLASNIIYGRSDLNSTKFTSLIEENSFINNYIIDSSVDTIVHRGNFGIYGSEENFNLKNNFFNSLVKDSIQKTLYDQTKNYTSPLIQFDPFLKSPTPKIHSHIYKIMNNDEEEVQDSLLVSDSSRNFIVQSNNEVDFSIAKLKFYYRNESNKISSTLLNFKVEALPNYQNQITISTSIDPKKIGYIEISDIKDIYKNNIGISRIGYYKYLKKLYDANKLDEELLARRTEIDSLDNEVSKKMFFEKIDLSFKERLEGFLMTGSSIFTGSISNSNLLSNDTNLLLGLHLKYIVFSKLSAGISLLSFKLSNSDLNSENNDKISRGFAFSNSVISLSPEINYDFFDNREFSKLTRYRPSVGFGLDVLSFNPKGTYKNTSYALQPLSTGGQLFSEEQKSYGLLALGYFLTVKFMYKWSKMNSVGFHFSYHKSFSEYLDDVGPDIYPDSNLLLEELGPEAAYFSNPSGRYNPPGSLRNYPNDGSDSFVNFGFFYARKLFLKQDQ